MSIKLRNIIIVLTCICEWSKDRLMGRGGPSLLVYLHWFGPSGLDYQKEEDERRARQEWLIHENLGPDEWDCRYEWPEEYLKYPEVQKWIAIADQYRAEHPERYQ